MYGIKENIRLALGVIIVVGIFFFIGISSCAEKHKGINDMLSMGNQYLTDFPNEFSNEVLDVNSIEVFDIRVSTNQKIVGFSINGDARNAFNIFKSKLQDKNWKCLDSGNDYCASFYKDEGFYTWLFLNCIKVGESCSVVFTFD